MVAAGDLAFWRDRLEGSSRHGLFLLLAQVILPHPDGMTGIQCTRRKPSQDAKTSANCCRPPCALSWSCWVS
jgi:hypothetical protein